MIETKIIRKNFEYAAWSSLIIELLNSNDKIVKNVDERLVVRRQYAIDPADPESACMLVCYTREALKQIRGE